MITYLEIKFTPVINEEARAILIAELENVGFDSFTEEEDALLAYIHSDIFSDELLSTSVFLINNPEIKTEINPLEDKNWNTEWESNYQPVTINNRCHVRAPFHPALSKIQYEIIIEPGMAFGTAHHETTQLMATKLMEIDVAGKNVLDMGCGSGVLAILANKMQARSVTAIDNDEWAWRNCMLNFKHNGYVPDKVLLGDVSLIRPGAYDLVLANINRNILLQDMNQYYKGLTDGGLLLLSGFYRKDIDTIFAGAKENGLHLADTRTLNDWAVILFEK